MAIELYIYNNVWEAAVGKSYGVNVSQVWNAKDSR